MNSLSRTAVVAATIATQLFGAAMAQAAPSGAGTADTPPSPAPFWSKLPNSDDLAKVYPRQAEKRGLEGIAHMTCKVHPDGWLSTCVATAIPPGAGFEAAAVKLASRFRLNLAGRPTKAAGGAGTVQVPIAFRLIKD